jgi:hypothetical protein
VLQQETTQLLQKIIMDDNKTDVTKHGDRLFQQQLRRIVLRPLCRNTYCFLDTGIVSMARRREGRGERGKAEGEETKTKPGEKEKPLLKNTQQKHGIT